MKLPFQLVPDSVSTDMIECTRTLYEQAQKGELIGLAFTGMIKSRGYIANAAGEAHRNPTFAIGMCFALIQKFTARLQCGPL